MQITSRRRLDVSWMVGGGLAVGAVALLGARFGDNERVERLWTTADLAPDGSAQVTEVIDYDFGFATDKHGIFRYVWDLSPDAPITVASDAPDDIQVTPQAMDGREGARIRIGDPDTTISGRHRYRIDYPLPGVARATTLDWEAVGVGWEVGIDEAEIHVVAPFELLDPVCSKGVAGSEGGCEVREVAPGHLAATVKGLDSGEGVSIEARTGSDFASPPAPPPPTTAPDDPGTGLLPPAAAAAGAALLAAGPTALLVRLAGRERVRVGGPADAAWAGTGPAVSTSWVRVDQKELEAMATTEFAPPRELDPPHGGIVLTEDVRPEHKVAWLIQMAIDGTIDIGANRMGTVGAGGPWTPPIYDDVRLVRTGHGKPDAAAILDTAFAGRDEVELGSYDAAFARAWRQLEGQLTAWRDTSGMWDPASGTRKILTRVLGIVGGVVGALIAGGGGVAASRWGPAWLAVAALGGAVAGAGLAAALRAWELRVRTRTGSAAWLRVESFRRFLAESEAYHAEEAAKRGVLREYTAWAVAVGEIDRWQRAVSASSIAPETAGLSYAYMAPELMSSTTSAATAPQSNGGGGGGFGGGSVGGGTGGGGGGSW
ncbi:MAG TPA: DUF2207 domain-containing protein [Acidimicrobiales bacterium]|jgi:hypothetical protein|nr:DUF2207 domain-containing protein [Acidimicrobiales bacterium]